MSDFDYLALCLGLAKGTKIVARVYDNGRFAVRAPDVAGSPEGYGKTVNEAAKHLWEGLIEENEKAAVRRA